MIIALSCLTAVRPNAGKKNTCTEQQYIVISNINDIKKIDTCNLTALVNILRHFCDSIDLLVSSVLGNDNRTLSFIKKKRERQKERIGTCHVHIYLFFLNISGLLLCLASLWGLSCTKDLF